MTTTESDYFIRRFEDEMKRAEQAKAPAASAIHYELAQAYLKRAGVSTLPKAPRPRSRPR